MYRAILEFVLNVSVLQGGIVSTLPKPQAGGPPLVDCPRLLIQLRNLVLFPEQYTVKWVPTQ
jgi:hypothetical protein